MQPETFDVIFRGDIVLGHALDDVKVRLQKLFKVDASKIDALFTGRPVILKRNLDSATAEKYRKVLHQAGAQIRLAPSGGAQSADKPKARPVRGLSLAPVGGYLVAPQEHRRLAPVTVDTSALSLRESDGELLDPHERAAMPDLDFTIPDFELAHVGADLVTAAERPELPLVAVEPEEWSLAEVGSDLLSASERPQIEPVAVGATDFDLAPVGSDLGPQKAPVAAPVPDTSALRLMDND